jgi:hypothetical protein
MMEHSRFISSLLDQSEQDSESATIELRNFKKAGLELIKTCQIRNIINPFLADHVVREVEHFLYMIHILEERLKKKEAQMNK